MGEVVFVPEKMIRFDDFLLDFGRFQLCRGNEPVRLEGLPLQALMFLIEQKGQLVTREQMADVLWGKDVFVDVEQGINTVIRKIRMALEDDAGQPRYLQTVVGRGYRFVARVVEDDALAGGAASGPTSGTMSSPISTHGMVTPEELGRAIMTAAGLDPENPKGPLKVRGNS